MNTKAVLPGQLGLGNASNDEAEGIKTLETEAIKKVVREDWESKVIASAVTAGMLSKHAKFMNLSPNFEAAYMSNVATNTKRMTRCEAQAYLRTMEALKVGFTARFGSSIANLVLLGMSFVSRDSRTARVHLDGLVEHFFMRASSYVPRIDRESRRMDAFARRLKANESSLFRFFRRRESAALRSAIERKRERIVRLQSRKSRHESVMESVKQLADPYNSGK